MNTTPHFDGKTYQPELDFKRLSGQLADVRNFMLRYLKFGGDGWFCLASISHALGYPESSVSARLRDLRKPKFGGYTVDRQRAGKGTFLYRVRP